MPKVDIDDETYGRLLVTSQLLGETVGEVVYRLVNRLLTEPAQTPVRTSQPQREAHVNEEETVVPTTTAEWISVYKIYKGHRVEGSFNPNTMEVRLSTAPWTNKYFASPTAAAVAVVDHYSGDVRTTSNTNGRKFWRLASTGENLHSVIGER